MVDSVFHVAIVLPTASKELTYEPMPKKEKISFGLLVWDVGFVQPFAPEGFSSWKMDPRKEESALD